ncbi:uncharacterized protein LOC111878871 [Lactuca sativa]|uniref:uncharacterized protein LOC111878871 n=1 Tax=Lactuca sativa TaxID=4236 RepID=UPI000CD9F761|nr:uncharacterized protein LOC111878871 [Lactuca sativa]
MAKQTLKEQKKNGDKGKEKDTRESSGEKARHPSFKTFKSSSVTEFSDVLNPIVVLTWIQNTEKVFCVSHVDNEDKAIYASVMVIGEALVRYEEKEFLELKHGGITVNEYETQFSEKARFAAKYIPTEDEKIQLFLEGLRHEINDFVTNQDVLSFEKAIEYAQRRELDLEISGATLTVPKHPHTKRTAPISTIPPARSVRTDPSKQAQSQSAFCGCGRSQSFYIQSPSCRVYGRNHLGQCKIDKESIFCYRCGETSHIKPSCPRKDVTCYACGIIGHKKCFCPTLTSQVMGTQASVQQPKNTPAKNEEVQIAKGRAF